MNFIVRRLLQITQKLWFSKPTSTVGDANRRQLLKHSLQAAVMAPVVISSMVLSPDHAYAQPARSAGQARTAVIAQIVDVSTQQQDISKDFLIGSRAAWQDINARGGIRGRSVTHWVLETDGTPQSAQDAWQQVRNNPLCLAVSGCTADPLATQINAFARDEKFPIAHVAPWLQNSSTDLANQTFAIFSTREEQIAHALRSLTTLSISNLAVVFATPADRLQNLADIQRIASKLGLQLQEKVVQDNLVNAGSAILSTTAAVILFVGGTPELAQFIQGLDNQSRQRYVVALADVNLQVLQQLGSMRNTAVIATQAVPMVNSAMPVVRQYRQVMSRLYDEPPTALSLAGFIAAQYTFEVMQGIETAITRSSVLEAFERRQAVDIGGFRVAFQAQRRTTAFVTQSMLRSDGRVVG
jgi:ABC-type branched-subunit amino acid transport system substrate-binding protein